MQFAGMALIIIESVCDYNMKVLGLLLRWLAHLYMFTVKK